MGQILQTRARGARLFGMFGSRPQVLLRACAFLLLVAAVLSLLLMLRVPLASVDSQMGTEGKIELSDGSRRVIVPGTAQVAFRSLGTGQSITLEASLLPGVAEPRGTASQNQKYWQGRDDLAHMLAAATVEVRAGGQILVARTRLRTLSDLTFGFWLSLLAGSIAALIGLWVWVLRPGEWAPVMFGISGAGLFVGCATTALNISPGLGLSGTIDHALMIVNYISGVVCAGTLAALFARFPAPIIDMRWLWPLGLANAGAAAVVGWDIAPGAVDLAILVVLGDSIAIIALLIAQGWVARGQPQQRAGLMPIAICTGVSTFLFCTLSMIGQIDGGRPLVMPDITAPLLLLIYLGLAAAITRAKLFALGRWALWLLLSAVAILLFVLCDALILSKMAQQRDLAFLASVLVAATVYLPARAWFLRRAERFRSGQASQLLGCAGDIALALTPQAARAAWHDAIRAMFDPLEMSESGDLGSEAAILENNRALYLPGPTGGGAMILRYPGGGTRVFLAGDLATAVRFGDLVGRLSEARDAYVRGVDEERGRIAQDLHDDVNARLLTSLHRSDPKAMQDDVRGAIADIRTIVTGLSGSTRSLQSVLAALRHESQMRLEAANILVDWPYAPLAEDDTPLGYEIYRNLLSIVRECISNVVRHSQASRLRAEITVRDDCLSLTLADDGRGFPTQRGDGRGIDNAAQRAGRLGGTFSLRRIANETHATIVLPFSKQAGEG